MKADKIKKMEELRKRLLQLDDNEWSKLIDNSNEVDQWRVDLSNRMRIDNIAHKEGAREKMSAISKERNKNGWVNPNRYEWTVEDNPNKGGNKGTENPLYGKGAVYKELTTEFEGTFLDMKTKFPKFTLGLVNRKRIRKDSIYPEYSWIVVRQPLAKKNNHPKDFSERVKQGKSKMQIEVFFNSKSLGIGDVSFASKTASISEWKVYDCIKKNICSFNGYSFKKLPPKE